MIAALAALAAVAAAVAGEPIFSVETLDVRAPRIAALSQPCADLAVEAVRARAGSDAARWAERAAVAVGSGALQDLAFWDLHVLPGVDHVPAAGLGACFAASARPFVALHEADGRAAFTSAWVGPDTPRSAGLARLAGHAAAARLRALVVSTGSPSLAPADLTFDGRGPYVARAIGITGTPAERAAFAAALVPGARGGTFLILY